MTNLAMIEKGKWDTSLDIDESIDINLELSDDEIEQLVRAARAKPFFGCRGNSRYHDDIPKGVAYMYRNGESDAEVAIKIGISKPVFISWLKKYPDFRAAVAAGRALSEAWWQNLGRNGAMGVLKVQPGIWFAVMKNRFNWAEKVQVEQSEQSQEIVDINEQVQKIMGV